MDYKRKTDGNVMLKYTLESEKEWGPLMMGSRHTFNKHPRGGENNAYYKILRDHRNKIALNGDE